ncbi:MAG: trigger factor [Armatimonadetes bacterium]|nr:trigger factor [Armatimonadota bacterium]
MSVQVARRELDHCSVELKIEVPAEQVQQAIERETQRALKRVSVPGFRRGKAPRQMAQRYIDAERVRERAIEQTAIDAYTEAVRESGLVPFGSKVDLDPGQYRAGEALSFTATVSLPPHVHLGQYEGLEVIRIVPEITEADVEREINRIREVLAQWRPKEGPSAHGDRVRATVITTIDGEPIPTASVENAWLEIGSGIPALDQGLIGLAVGEERDYTFTFPGDDSHPEWRSREAHAHITIHEVSQRALPEVDDALAKQLGVEDPVALRQRIRTSMEAQARSLADAELREELLRRAVSNATVHLPEEMVTRRVAERTADLVKQLERHGLTLDDYLVRQQITLHEMDSRLAEETRRGIQQTLVLLEIARAAQITVEDAAIDAAIRDEATQRGLDEKQTRRLLQDEEERDRTRTSLLIRNVLEHLQSTAKIEEKTA